MQAILAYTYKSSNSVFCMVDVKLEMRMLTLLAHLFPVVCMALYSLVENLAPPLKNNIAISSIKIVITI